MAFDAATYPFLTPYSLSGDSSFGTPFAVNVFGDPTYNMTTLFTGSGGTLEIRPTGNLLSLSQVDSVGFLCSLVAGDQIGTRIVSAGNGISIVNGNGVSGNIEVSVTDDTTTQKHNAQANGVSVGAAMSTINFIEGPGVDIEGATAGSVNTITISAPGKADSTSHYVVTQEETSLTNSTNLGALTTGLVKNSVSTGVSTLSTAVGNTDYMLTSSSLIDIYGLSATSGSLLYYAGGHWVTLAPGTAGQVLSTLDANTLSWNSGSGIANTWSLYPATTNVNFDGFKGINALDPTGPQDVATKAYADSIVGGAPLGAFYVTTQANSTLTNEVSLGLLTTGLVTSTVSGSTSTVSITDPATFVQTTGAQTIAGVKTFSSAPVMSGASITAATIPIASVVGTAMDLTTAQTVAGIKTFSSPPVMSGASITAATIPAASVVGTAATLAATQTLAGDNTFSGAVTIGGALTITTGAVAGYFLTSDLDGVATWDSINEVPSNYSLATTAFTQDLIVSGYTGTANTQMQAGVQTSDASPVALFSIAIPSSRTVTVFGTIVGSNTGHTDATGGFFSVTAQRAGGGASLAGSPFCTVNKTSTGNFTANVSGNNLVIYVTGLALTTYNWVCNYSYQILNDNT